MAHKMKFFWILLCVFCIASCATGQEKLGTSGLQPVSLQLQWIPQAQFAGYYVALDKGWYRDEGIDLTIKPGGPESNPVELVANGKSDFGTALLADLAVAVQKGRPVISIGQIQQRNGLYLASRKSSNIKQPKDFIGKRVGIWQGNWEAQFNALIAKEGVLRDDITVIPQGFGMEPFQKGELDVTSVMIYNEFYFLIKAGMNFGNLNLIDYASYGLAFPGDTLFTNRQTVSSQRDLCVRMLRASLKGWQHAIDYPNEAVDIVQKYAKNSFLDYGQQVFMMQEISRLVRTTGYPLGRPDGVAIKRMIDTLQSSGTTGGPIRPGDVYTIEFWSKASAQDKKK
jgi:NitT/TauT family transport system substrate-binding protein